MLKTTLTPLFESKSILHEVNERKANKGFRCIYCGMDEIVRFGKTAQDRQRYKCKCCDKTFTETADMPLYHCRKSEKWIDFLSCLIDGMSLRDSAKEISVHYVTLFY